uniref:Uncharacterized protein n=1 Tax=Timema shepardi TaxID=629360 RepID=A0A7R9AZ92_TIMSH|nr:unnamed protein product [Timema shepardi]
MKPGGPQECQNTTQEPHCAILHELAKRCTVGMDVSYVKVKWQRGSGEVVSVAGPYTIPLISPDMQYEGEDEVFSFKYITDCARNNRQLDLNRYRRDTF